MRPSGVKVPSARSVLWCGQVAAKATTSPPASRATRTPSTRRNDPAGRSALGRTGLSTATVLLLVRHGHDPGSALPPVPAVGPVDRRGDGGGDGGLHWGR